MSDTAAGKWDFTSDEARHDAIMAEAEIAAQAARDVAEKNAEAQVEAAEARGPVWHFAAFWLGLFAYLIAELVFKRA